MKKFIVGIVVSIVFVMTGAFTLFFEFSDYEIVESADYNRNEADLKTYEFDGDQDYIVINGEDDLRIEWQYDDNIGNQVKVLVDPYVDSRKSGNVIDIDNDNFSFKQFKKSGEYLLDGLKQKEIRLFHHDVTDYGTIIIQCSPTMRNKVIIND